MVMGLSNETVEQFLMNYKFFILKNLIINLDHGIIMQTWFLDHDHIEKNGSHAGSKHLSISDHGHDNGMKTMYLKAMKRIFPKQKFSKDFDSDSLAAIHSCDRVIHAPAKKNALWDPKCDKVNETLKVF